MTMTFPKKEKKQNMFFAYCKDIVFKKNDKLSFF